MLLYGMQGALQAQQPRTPRVPSLSKLRVDGAWGQSLLNIEGLPELNKQLKIADHGPSCHQVLH